MSKLIVEMEMPKFCWDCACCDSEYRYCAARRKTLDELNDRPDWCPIVGVLPDEHGDLIDADAIWERAGQKKGEADPLRLAAELCCSPVIIAAERKDDEQD